MSGDTTMGKRFLKEFRSTILTGIFILIPVVLSVYILWRVFMWVDTALPGVLGVHWPRFVGFVVSLAIVYLAGLATKNWVGRKIIATGNAIIVSIPVLNRLYLIIKQIVDAVRVDKKKLFERVVLMKYPHKECWVLGFVTSENNDAFSAAAGKKLIAVFVPNAPNPTTGFLFYALDSDLTTVDIPVETAFKLIVSAGVLGASHDGAAVDLSQPIWRRNWMELFGRKSPEKTIKAS